MVGLFGLGLGENIYIRDVIIINYEYILGLNYIGIRKFSLLILLF